MKRNILYIAMACMIAFVSCKKENGQQSQECREVEFGAALGETNGSKTFLNGTSVLWADGDQISVNGTAIDLVAGAGYNYGTFRGKVTPCNADEFFVGYPASATTFNTSTSEMSLTIPAVQTHNATQTLLGQLPMAAFTEGTGNKMTLHFHNAANILNLSLWSNTATTVKNIVVISSSAPLSGIVPVNVSAGEISFGNMTSTGQTITLNCDTPVEVSTDENNPTPFYFFIPKIEANTVLTVRIYDSDYNCQEQHLTVDDSHNNSLMTSVNKLYINIQNYTPVAAQFVDFSEYEFNGKLKNVSLILTEINKSIVFQGTTSGGFEKVIFPINHLEVGEWYTISFGELLTKEGSGSWWCDDGTYASAVRATKELGDGVSSALPNATGTTNELFVWTHSPRASNSGLGYTPVTNASTTFKATASTMYWIWDYSKLRDGVAYTFDCYLTDVGIRKLEVAEGPRANLLATEMYGYKSSAGTGENCKLSYKVYADNNRLELIAVGVDGQYEKVNIPLVELTVGTRYRLTFDYHRTKLFSGNDFINSGSSLDNCFGISASKNTQTGNVQYNNTTGYTANFTDADLLSYTLEFTATATTMYWVWSQSNLTDNQLFNQVVDNVTLEEIPEE